MSLRGGVRCIDYCSSHAFGPFGIQLLIHNSRTAGEAATPCRLKQQQHVVGEAATPCCMKQQQLQHIIGEAPEYSYLDIDRALLIMIRI